ncbi:DUF2255 family protein [Serratia sp. 3ACOL1]|uniref:DUF2255 family protein n=1 Tax=Serratia sp. 3ACOL1 TaxID=2448483 RepID=UPI000EF4F15D|nr:DUF2255 family protein [Serratia sp. 3ACOL1]AYM91025.1 DUF2255 family protein [Serratia sp. 3ACOL1]
MSWPEDELQRIIDEDDLHISLLREDGKTYGTPTWIWCVHVDDDLYVRARNGCRSRWFQAAERERAGRIIIAGIVKDVILETVSSSINRCIDEAYRKKYQGSPYLEPMVSEDSRAATIKITPRL